MITVKVTIEIEAKDARNIVNNDPVVTYMYFCDYCERLVDHL